VSLRAPSPARASAFFFWRRAGTHPTLPQKPTPDHNKNSCAYLKSDPGCNLATVTEVKQYSQTIVAPIEGDVSTWSTALVLALSALAEAFRALANQLNSFTKTEIVATASATEGVTCPSSNSAFAPPVCSLLDTGAFSVKGTCPSGMAAQVYCQATQKLGDDQKARAVALVAQGTTGADFYCSADATRGLEAGPVTLYVTATCMLTAQPSQQAMEASTSAAITIKALMEALANITGGGKAVLDAVARLIATLSVLPVSVPVQPTINTLITVLLEQHAGNATVAFNATEFAQMPCGCGANVCGGCNSTIHGDSFDDGNDDDPPAPPDPYNIPDDGDDDGGSGDPCAGGDMSGGRCKGKKGKKGGGKGKYKGARIAAPSASLEAAAARAAAAAGGGDGQYEPVLIEGMMAKEEEEQTYEAASAAPQT
jgi:hypothetical protein